MNRMVLANEINSEKPRKKSDKIQMADFNK